MTNAQIYFALGLPSLVALVGILVSVGYYVALNGRMSRLEQKMETLTGKVAEIDNRVIRIEDKLGIVPRYQHRGVESIGPGFPAGRRAK